jgi:hypothetical protein
MGTENAANELVDNSFNLRTPSLIISAADSSDADSYNGNDGVSTIEYSLTTKQQSLALSCCVFIFGYDSPRESENDYIFDKLLNYPPFSKITPIPSISINIYWTTLYYLDEHSSKTLGTRLV